MQGRNLILIGIALALGLVAVFLANSYFSGVETRQERIAEQQKLSRIVVASQDLAFGVPLSDQNLRVANWPANSVPVGAFTTIADATRDSRVALRPIVVGEPVLASKVSGRDGRATLSANLPIGKLAYSVPVNDVSGVGGFVRPGDVVDVLLTRPIPGAGSSGTDKMTDVVLEAVPVLGIDQVSDENQTKPATAKTATLEVDTLGAQKLALSVQLGTLSLALRNVADPATGPRPTIVPRHLTSSGYAIPARNTAAGPTPPRRFANAIQRTIARAAAAIVPSAPRGPSMVVVRGSNPTEYEVQRGR